MIFSLLLLFEVLFGSLVGETVIGKQSKRYRLKIIRIPRMLIGYWVLYADKVDRFVNYLID